VISVFFFSPNLSRRRLDVCHTSTHGVPWCEFKMQVWNVLHAARWKTQDAKKSPKSPSGQHPTSSSGNIFAAKAHIDSQKNLLSSNMSSTCLHNMVNFGRPAPETIQ